ncbi:MAG: polysaccharide deacetylase family protein [Acidimicrobiia bacterium]
MKSFVTTSWDDGGTHDARLTEMLERHGVTGTLYWTVGSDRFPLPPKADRDAILGSSIEIGSHTMTHPDMRAIDAAALAREVTESKSSLEDLTGGAIPSFCYPFGYFDDRAAAAVKAAGYSLGRTTMGFQTDLGDDPFKMPVTLQLYPHGAKVHLAHALKERNFSGLGRWLTTYGRLSDLVSLAEAAVDDVARSGGVLHIWGHSWELEEYDLWNTLDEVLNVVGGRDDVTYCTNGDLVRAD